MFNSQLLLGTFVITCTVVFHVIALVALAGLLKFLGPKLEKTHSHWLTSMYLLVVSVMTIIAIHTIEAWSWAMVYIYLGEFTELAPALYFSITTSTTLGYGDITLSERWQLLGTFEAMGGLILFGASTAFLLGFMRRLFEETTGPTDT